MSKFIRLTLIILSFIFFGLGSLVLSIIVFPAISLFKAKKETYAQIIHISWKNFVKILEQLNLIKVNINNNYPINGKIIVASHPSFIDILILIGMIKKSTCIAKNEVLKNPLLRNIVKHIYIVNDIDINNLVNLSKEYLQNDFNIIIFPTGTRTEPGKELKIHKGAAAISLATNTPIVPINIKTSSPFLCKNQPIYKIENKRIDYNITIMDEISPFDYENIEKTIARKRISERIKKSIQ